MGNPVNRIPPPDRRRCLLIDPCTDRTAVIFSFFGKFRDTTRIYLPQPARIPQEQQHLRQKCVSPLKSRVNGTRSNENWPKSANDTRERQLQILRAVNTGDETLPHPGRK